MYRPSAIAIEEFAPGNFVYANGHKLRSIRVLFAGGPGLGQARQARSDAETSGRLRSFQFCDHCDGVTEEIRNTCGRCSAPLSSAVECVFVDAFEAEEARRRELEAAGRLPGQRGPQSPIESRLLEALQKIPDLPVPVVQYEIRDGDRLVTVPDFAYPDEHIAIFCDGFAFHGNAETLELDARKRNWLQSKDGGEWIVLTYWGRTIMRDAKPCAREIADTHRRRGRFNDAPQR